MKKIAGILFAMTMIGMVLSGCYSRSCGEQPAPISYKDEVKMK